MSEKKQNPARTNGAALIAGGGVLSGLFAVLGASCCVLPVLLVNLGVSSALVANLAIFAKYRAAMVGVAMALVIAAIVFARRDGRPRRSGSGSAPVRRCFLHQPHRSRRAMTARCCSG